ncbi:alpha/beta fold hydrolase [Kineosporia sp. J2-2]|uniref:Alpha/beta fold hydrolase n=1 Tax=Kineosporia corallincola TaxID=2835133 RepID=A0ABS5TFQ6_9ACTN|nr:alpha/beta hydrolase [Kineosporia corallincola]MBT0769921.1 alpha/beta fold hydrolase [Kineosporia corallincola]
MSTPTRTTLVIAALAAVTMAGTGLAHGVNGGGTATRSSSLGSTTSSTTSNSLGSTVSSNASAQVSAADIAAARWKPCTDAPKVDCAKVTVPVDWSKPDGEKIRIALARREATNPKTRIGSLLYNPGGPGVSGVAMIKGSAASAFSKKVRSRFDIVGFDPRGVGSSTAVRCPAGGARERVLTEKVTDTLFAGKGLSGKKLRQIRAANRKDGQTCRELSGAVADHLDSLSVARDMDGIRSALGDDKLTFYGLSYGTLLGQQYATLFPGRVRALLLDSNLDHSLSGTGFLVSQAAAVQDSFDQYVAWCDRSSTCTLHRQGARAVFTKLRLRAQRGRLRDPDTGEKVGVSMLIDTTQTFLSGPDWTSLSSWYSGLLSGRVVGDSEHLRTASYGRDPGEKSADGIFCSDWRTQFTGAAQLRTTVKRMRAVAPDMRMSSMAMGTVLGCQGWPTAVRAPQAKLKWAGVPAVLLVNSLHDPATPYSGARDVARQSGARLLTYNGWGHGVIGRRGTGSCLRDAATLYLVNLKVPASGRHCAAAKV